MQEKERNKDNFGRNRKVGRVVLDNKNNRHAKRFLLSISTALTNQGQDPEQQRLRMTSLFKTTHGFTQSLSSPKVFVGDLAVSQRTDSRQRHFGMTLGNGFTLIELLVVVLIIGILAAVAVPQYQKAVMKSRIAEMNLLRANLEKSVDLYILTYNSFPASTDIDKLDIGFSSYVWDENAGEFCGNSGICFSIGGDNNVVLTVSMRRKNKTGEPDCAIFSMKNTISDPWTIEDTSSYCLE